MENNYNQENLNTQNISKEPKQMDPKYVWYYFLKKIWSAILFAFLLSWFSNGFLFWFLSDKVTITSIIIAVIITLIFTLIILYIWARLVYHFYRYEVKDKEFRKEYGVLNKKYASIPYSRIQNVDIDRSLLQRIFGLSELRIQTAGEVSSAEGRLPGLGKDQAEQLRERLLEIAKREDHTSNGNI